MRSFTVSLLGLATVFVISGATLIRGDDKERSKRKLMAGACGVAEAAALAKFGITLEDCANMVDDIRVDTSCISTMACPITCPGAVPCVMVQDDDMKPIFDCGTLADIAHHYNRSEIALKVICDDVALGSP